MEPHQPGANVTFLFTDIEGSTQLVEALGEDYGELLHRHIEILRAAATSDGGQEVDIHGDSYFAVFQKPSDAISAATQAQKLIHSEPWVRGISLRVRMGMHTGTARAMSNSVVGYVGYDVHRAARICGVANGGQVLLSSATVDAMTGPLPSGVHCRQIGTHRLKDIRAPETIWELVIEGLPEQVAPIRSLNNRPTNLPTAVTPFVGRMKDRARVKGLLLRSDIRLLTVTGPAGTGKTRLAIEVASQLFEQFPDGIYIVDLAPIADAQLVLPAIAQAMGIHEFPGRSVLETITHAIEPRKILLILDNFEHVLAAGRAVIELLNHCPNLKVLLTSREAIDVAPEYEFPLPPMTTPERDYDGSPDEVLLSDSAQLFVDRVRRFRDDFSLDNTTAPIVAEICRRVDGLPLAIELAASRLRLLEPASLLERLTERLDTLGRDDRHPGARHRTMRNAIASSYNLLDEKERLVFRKVSVFAGRFSLQQAVAICEGGMAEMQTTEMLTSLLRKSLLQRESFEGESGMRMLDTVREFGLERLRETDEFAGASGRLIALMLAKVRKAAPDFVGSNRRRTLIHVSPELPQVRVAMEFAFKQGDLSSISEFLGSLFWLWLSSGRISEANNWISRAKDALDHQTPPLVRARILDVAGWFGVMTGDWAGAHPYFAECRPLYEELGLPIETARSLMAEGVTKLFSKPDETGRRDVEQALAALRPLGSRYEIGLTLTAMGEASRLEGNNSAAQLYLDEALQHMRAVDNTFWTGIILQNLSHVRLHLEDWENAVRLLSEVLLLAEEYDDPLMVSYYLGAMGRVALLRARSEDAARLFGATESSLRNLGARFEPADQAAYQHDLARLRDRLGDESFTKHFDEGARWDRDEAVAAAMSLRG